MNGLSIEASIVSIRSIAIEKARLEQQLEETSPTDELVDQLADDLTQIIKVLGELHNAYNAARTDQPYYPEFNELIESSLPDF